MERWKPGPVFWLMKMNGLRLAFSIPELLVAMALLMVLSTISFLAIQQSSKVLFNVSGHQDVSLELAKAKRRMERDLLPASQVSSQICACPDSLGGGGKDGQAICFLSPFDESGSGPQKNPEGTALFRRNVIYYLSVPLGHQGCTSSADASGYDQVCPHKVLIRQRLDYQVSAPSGNAQALLPASDLATLLVRPNLENLGASTVDPRVRSIEVVARQLLSMRISFNADVDVFGEVEIRLWGANLDDRKKGVVIGQDSLAGKSFLEEHRFSVFPQN